MQPQTHSTGDGSSWQRYGQLALWAGAALLLLLIPLKILSTGFLPQDDALRHVAKAISGRAWPEIILVRPGFGDDEHPGWHAILGALHRWLAWDADALIYFSVLVPAVVFWLALLLGGRRPAALLAAMFAASLSAPGTFVRPLFGWPYVLMMIVYVIALQLWTRREKISATVAAVTTGLIGLSVWVHGSWYLFGIVPAGLVLAGEWRKSLRFTACWLAGALLGATLTGHPFSYLWETTMHLLNVFGGQPLPRMLVTELQPDSGDLAFVIVIGLVLLWRAARGKWHAGVVRQPLFVLAALGWLLGLHISRFWLDWGFPAALLWLAQELEEGLPAAGNFPAVLLAGFAGAGLYIATTRDIGSRWTSNIATEYVTPETPGIAGWLPEPGGLVYSSDMAVFFRCFYKNPHAPWRYVLGFEPGVMPEEDFAILRKIQWNWFAPITYEPWVKKMKPADRLILLQNTPPGFPGLEWHYAAAETWIGRLPRTNAPAAAKP